MKEAAEEKLRAFQQKDLDDLGDLELVKYLALLSDKQDEIKVQLDEYEDTEEEVKDVVLERMVKSGADKISAGGRTVYIHEQDWTRVVDKRHAEAVKRLQQNGLEDLIVLGSSRVSSYFRDHPLEDQPEDLQEIFDVYTRKSIRVRSS